MGLDFTILTHIVTNTHPFQVFQSFTDFTEDLSPLLPRFPRMGVIAGSSVTLISLLGFHPVY